jgi:hypothetical protein
MPDMDLVNTRLSPKALLFPQSEEMLEYSLDESRDDHHIMKEVARDDSPRAVVGIRPCDAKATLLVKLNFDTPDVKDPYWLAAYQATTFIGMACDTPLSTCFCTTAGCGPYHEEGLDVLVMDRGDAYLAKILTDKGKAFADAAGWTQASDDAAAFEAGRKAAEAGSSPRWRLTTWPTPSFWNFTAHPSGKMWPLPASTAAPAHSHAPPAGASTFRTRFTARPVCVRKTGTAACSPFSPSIPPGTIPGIPRPSGSASASCTSLNIS